MCVLLLSHLGSASGMVFQVDSFWDNAERLNPDNKKRTCRRIDAGLGENELAQACWITDWGSESKGFIAQECLPGNLQGRQSSVIAADNGRRPTQPCSRCLAGESIIPKRPQPEFLIGRGVSQHITYTNQLTGSVSSCIFQRTDEETEAHQGQLTGLRAWFRNTVKPGPLTSLFVILPTVPWRIPSTEKLGAVRAF
ncbi:uncharacterized protein C10orf143 homolog isoform X2 [Notamacropus eugenii]|uniref:uncharacterized protein C10orf143 homolog isoform X2 n=1 Tax=Notamacropus eugenii TaxID=9315 RepID=UPI003B6823EC